MLPQQLKNCIRDIPDHPKPGVIFRDITPLLANAEALEAAASLMAAPFAGEGIKKVAAIDARGFIFGGIIALKLNAGLVPVRKKGKLPWNIDSAEYALEYGSGVLEIHTDAFSPGENVLIVDDLLATGGTVEATWKLAKKQGAVIKGASFMIELDFLNGRSRFDSSFPVSSIIHY